MSELHIAIRERKDRPGTWLVTVRREGKRVTSNHASEADANAYADEVKRAEAELLSAPIREPTLADAVQVFLKHKREEGRAESTVQVYSDLLEKAVVPGFTTTPRLRDLTEDAIKAYKAKRLTEVSPSTVRSELDRLRAVLRFAQDQGLVAHNPAMKVELPRGTKWKKDWLRSPEIQPFLLACPGDFMRIAKTAIFTGLRRGEMVYLQRGDIDLNNWVIEVRCKPHLGFWTKNRHDRSVPIQEIVRPFIEEHLKNYVGAPMGAWVFAQRSGARRSEKTRWFAESTSEAAQRAGIDRRLTFHDLRRTYGALLIESGVNIYEVSKLLGHQDIRVTQEVYAPITGRYLAKEASKMSAYMGAVLSRKLAPAPAEHPSSTQHPF